MAAIDFPDSPTVGVTVVRGGYNWIYNGSVWKKVASPTSVPTSKFYGFKFTASTGKLVVDVDDVDATGSPSYDVANYEDWFAATQVGGFTFSFSDNHLIMETN